MRFELETEYDGTEKPVNKVVPLVSVSVTTYQHKNFISQCLDGILMQQTNFPIEVIVGEDESTDGTRDICIEYAVKYPEKIRLFLRDRKTSQYYDEHGKLIYRFNALWTRMASRGKYIAICEGDDYWTDPLKLQRQLIFLERNEEYVAIAENGIVKNSIKNKSYLFSEEPERDLTIQEMVIKRRFPTASVMFRRETIKNFHKITTRSNDTILWCYIASKGKFRYSTNISSVYNRGMQGVVESTNEFEWTKIVESWNIELIRLFSDQYFHRKIAFDNIFNHYWNIYKFKKYNNYSQQIFVLFKCLRYNAKSTINKLFELNKTTIKRRIKNTIKLFIRNPATRNKLKSKYLKLRQIRNQKIKNEKKPSYYRKPRSLGISVEKRTPMIIVSLTSFPGRIKYVHYTLHTLLNQTFKPDKIILWLAKSQFPRREKELPPKLLKLQKYGLTIEWCEDLKSYKKLIPAISNYPDDIIVTADDDAYYPEDWLELLYLSFNVQPTIIHCQRAHRILFAENNKVLPYNQWEKIISNKESSFLTFFTSGGGVIFPPKCLHHDVLKVELFMKLSPSGDDIWFWAMAVMNGTRIRVIDNNNGNLLSIDGTQEIGLWNTINKYGQNDVQLENVLQYYKELREKLLSETHSVRS